VSDAFYRLVPWLKTNNVVSGVILTKEVKKSLVKTTMHFQLST